MRRPAFGQRFVAIAPDKKGETKMLWSLSRWCRSSVRVLLAGITVFVCASAAMSQAQSNAADLQGTVRDQNGAAVVNATVTARHLGTNLSREVATNEDGF